MNEKRWSLIISFLALLVSIASFIHGFQIDKSRSAPNVQVVNVDGERKIICKHNNAQIAIYSTIVLQNIGNAPVQIVDVQWAVVDANRTQKVEIFAISDSEDLLQKEKFFRFIERSPIIGINSRLIKPNSMKKLDLALVINLPLSGVNPEFIITNVRVTFVFSNGQQITVLPEFKYPYDEAVLPLSFNFEIGQQGYNCNKDPILLRAEASTRAKVIGSIPPSVKFEIIEGPECIEQRVWWKIQLIGNGIIGWVPETSSEREEVYICPLP